MAIGGKFRTIVKENWAANKLKKVFLLGSLANDQLKLLYSKKRTTRFKDGEIVVERGEESDCLYVVKEGRVSMLDESG